MASTIQPRRRARDLAASKIPRRDHPSALAGTITSDLAWRLGCAVACGVGWSAALLIGCRDPDPAVRAKPTSVGHPRTGASAAPAPASAPPDPQEFDSLAAAVAALVPPTTRLLGIGELHARTDRPVAVSSLTHFSREILPALAARTSDLVLETWSVDGSCGEVAATATRSIQAATRRPQSTQTELGALVAQTKELGLRAHAMRVTCADYQAMSGGGDNANDDAIVHMMDLTTAELTRIATALLHRPPGPRPLVVIYGGALHNDRFPDPGVEAWSYARAVEAPSAATFVELDVIVPELAEADPATARQPWAPLLGTSPRVVAYHRGERSYVLILPRTPVGK